MTIRTIPFLISCLLLTSCASTNVKSIDIKQTTDCASLSFKIGQEVIVTLPSAKHSMYDWKIKENATPVLALVNREVKRIKGSKATKDETIWHFKVMQSGKSLLTIDYQLEWDTDISNNQRFNCVIVANN